MSRAAAGLLVLLALGACGRQAPDDPPASARPEPVVVYASYEDEDYLPSLFAAFTRDTGIPVTVLHRPEQQAVSDVIENSGSPPADVLLTLSIHGAWRAGNEGALRPLQSETLPAVVPAWLFDPDGYWTAIGFTPIEVLCNADNEKFCDAIASFEDLSEPDLGGKLCLSGSSLAVGRSLIAGMIADHGTRPAETMVRGWVRNLASPPFDDEQALLQAVAAGTCAVGVATEVVRQAYGDASLAAKWPQPKYYEVAAAGIGRHARSADAARRLIEWLVGEEAQAAQFAATGMRPVNPAAYDVPGGFPAPAGKRNAGVFALFEIEAVKLAERARWP